jgi:hypothetical protein
VSDRYGIPDLDALAVKAATYQAKVDACEHAFTETSPHAPVSKDCVHCGISELSWLQCTGRETANRVRAVLLVPVLEKQKWEAIGLLRKALSTMRSGNCCDGEDASTSDEGRALQKELSAFLEPYTEPDRGE